MTLKTRNTNFTNISPNLTDNIDINKIVVQYLIRSFFVERIVNILLAVKILKK